VRKPSPFILIIETTDLTSSTSSIRYFSKNPKLKRIYEYFFHEFRFFTIEFEFSVNYLIAYEFFTKYLKPPGTKR